VWKVKKANYISATVSNDDFHSYRDLYTTVIHLMQCGTVVMKVYAVPVMIKYSRLFWFYRTASFYRKLYLVHTVRLFTLEFRM
jgi:hypothetical protein